MFSVLDTLMRRFRDLAVRDTLINVHDIGESLPLYHECSLTLEPLTWMQTSTAWVRVGLGFTPNLH